MNVCFSQEGERGGGMFSCHKNLVLHNKSPLKQHEKPSNKSNLMLSF